MAKSTCADLQVGSSAGLAPLTMVTINLTAGISEQPPVGPMRGQGTLLHHGEVVMVSGCAPRTQAARVPYRALPAPDRRIAQRS